MDLTTAYVFDAAHRLAGHPSNCAWLTLERVAIRETLRSASAISRPLT